MGQGCTRTVLGALCVLSVACGGDEPGAEGRVDDIAAGDASEGAASPDGATPGDPADASISNPADATTAYDGAASKADASSDGSPTTSTDAATDGAATDGAVPKDSGGDTGTTPVPGCVAAGGTSALGAVTVLRTLSDNGSESWFGSPAIADLDGNGTNEVIVARGGRVFAWSANGTSLFTFNTGKDRIWASPVVGNFRGDAKLEVAVVARDSVYLLDSAGVQLSGFPQTWATEMRTVGAGDVNGDGALDIVASVRATDPGTNTRDVVRAWNANGTTLPGFPPNVTGTSGCSGTNCYVAGTYDQNLAIGDLDGDGKADVVVPHDNAYASFHKGTGAAFNANPMFTNTTKTPGVRYLHALAEAQKGFADDETTALQAHFTNTAPAIADIDGDGVIDIVMLGSVQNAEQTSRELGVALWNVHSDASRRAGWQAPVRIPQYVVGLWDGFAASIDGPALAGAGNLAGATNQVSVADIDASSPGLEMVFAGFDGKIHAVGANGAVLWSTGFGVNGRRLTGGVVIGDLTRDGVPEIVFASYSPDAGGGALFVLDAKGGVRAQIALPKRGAMAVPTLGDVDGNGTLEIVVSLKDAEAGNQSVIVYTVAGSGAGCLPWPTGRGTLLRDGRAR